MNKPPLLKEYALLCLLALLWGSSYTFLKIALTDIPPTSLIAGRTLIACAVLYTVLRASGQRLPTSRDAWQRIGMQSLLNCTIPWLLLAWGAQFIPSSTAGVLNSTSPLWVIAFGLLIPALRAHPSWRERIGAAIGFVGVVLVMGLDALQSLGAQSLPQLAVTLSAAVYGLAALNGRNLKGIPTMVVASGTMVVAALCIVPLALLVDRPWTLAPSAKSLAAMVALGVFSTALGMSLYFRLVQTLGALGVASQSFLRSGVAVLLGLAILGERPTLSVLLGLGVIMVGVAAINWPTRNVQKG